MHFNSISTSYREFFLGSEFDECTLQLEVCHPRPGDRVVRWSLAGNCGLGEEAVQVTAVVTHQLYGADKPLPILYHHLVVWLTLYAVVVDPGNIEILTTLKA